MDHERTSESAAIASDELAIAALGYAARGWHVFPVAGKRPLTKHGVKGATVMPAVIEGWWRQHPDTGIGVRTGLASGLLVLDVDNVAGADTLHELERRHGELLETVRAVSGGGGAHYYFRHPGGKHPNTAGTLGVGIDTRGDGGYIVAPPSPHPAGRRYAWDIAPDELKLALPPKWLTATTRRAKDPRPVSEWRRLLAEGIAIGERNTRVAQIAGHLLARGIDPFVTVELLVAWDASRSKPPLGRGEITYTVASIARREAEKWTR